MALSLREYRARIKSTESMKKITRAMELIAASRIIKAQQRAQAAAPYARELTRAVSAVATFSNVDHPLTTEPEDPKRAAVLVVTSDRGLAGAYSSSVLKEAERLVEKLKGEGKEVDLYVTGRKGVAYYKFRQRPVVQSWTGFSDQPTYDEAREIGDDADRGVPQETSEAEEGTEPGRRGACGLHALPVDAGPGADRRAAAAAGGRRGRGEAPEDDDAAAALRVRAVAAEVLDALLPRYVQSRIFFALLQAAASELAARQRAMKSATDNAEELIKKYTRIANQARQAGITQEISEIVGGVNALADAQRRE